ncbi:hypothetical protein GCM10017673_31470 [Streptosporangium violaceochromogenes]|nr:hypothetical protein GCM10017673_31470 [Streptosporangium violaceochromogenes]
MTAEERVMRVVVVWPKPEDDGPVGLQDRAGELAEGRRGPDGSLRYETDVRVRPGRGGEALDFTGPHVHGAAGARFLYLSFRTADGSGWARRSKIMLPEAAPGEGTALRATLADVSGSRARLDATGWTVGR